MFFKKKSSYYKPHPYRLYQSREHSPFPYPTNSIGLLGTREYDIDNKAGKVRILVLGGSTVEELAFLSNPENKNPNAHWHKILEDILNASNNRSDHSFEVMAIASAGYTSYECLISYITQGRFLMPDIVLSYQGVNDVIWSFMAEGFKPDYSHVRDNQFPRLKSDSNSRTSANSRHSSILSRVLSRLNNQIHTTKTFQSNWFSQISTNSLRILNAVMVKLKLSRPFGLIYAISVDPYPQASMTYEEKRVDIYIENMRMLDQLCSLYDAKLINLTFQSRDDCFLSRLLHKNLSESEKKTASTFYSKYISSLNSSMCSSDLTTYKIPESAFKESDFRDSMHFSESGQEKIAHFSAKAIQAMYKKIPLLLDIRTDDYA